MLGPVRPLRVAVVVVAIGPALGACLPREQTTPLGYVIAPSFSPDAGGAADAGVNEGGRVDAGSPAARGLYSSAASESDARR
jgi:hypothetical protein